MTLVRDPNSPLIHAQFVSIVEVTYWDRSRFPEIDPRDDDEPYVVQTKERLDSLALAKLGSEQLGWVIMVRNGLALAPNDLVPGALIYIPSITGLKTRGVI